MNERGEPRKESTLPADPGSAAIPAIEFAAGTLLLGRFRIIHPIASGGMGTVYLATDEKLRQPRALKIAKPGYASHLPPEASTALRVTHPNVCRVFEIHTLDTPRGPVDFLSMEFVNGETLSTRLMRGPLPQEEALPIALQLCAGLAAAHAARLLHRDLKASNILLDSSVQPVPRAVITDFGLAQDQDLQTTLANQQAGTPAYLAPERWAGQRASVASDIYALGIVLHEIFTGVRPELVDGDPRMASRIVSQAVAEPLRGVIARCLNADPKVRYGSAEAVAEALAPKPVIRQRPSPYWALPLLLLLGIPLYQWLRPAAATGTVRLAIHPLEARNLSETEAGWVRDAGFTLSSQLTGLRPRPPQLVVIPIEETRGLPDAKPETTKQRLGATHSLRGNVTRRPDGTFHLEAQIIDTATGLPMREQRGDYSEASLVSAVPEVLTATVAAAFGLSRSTKAETVAPAAAAAYATAVALLRMDMGKSEAAAAAFEKAMALDPASTLPRTGFAEAAYNAWLVKRDATWLTRGREQLARAMERSPDSLGVHIAAGKLSLAPGAYERAREEFERATQLEPNSADAWRGLAQAYEAMTGHDNQAAAAYLKAMQIQPSYFAPLTDLCLFYRRLGQYDKSLEYCRQATAVAPGRAQTHTNLGSVLTEAGRYAEAEAEFRLSLDIDPKARMVLNNLGAIYQYLRRDEDAIAMFKKAQPMGPDSIALQINFGDAYRRLRKTAEAQASYRRGLELSREALAQNARDAITRAFLGYFLIRVGQTAAGKAEVDQALAQDERNKTVLRRAILSYVALGEEARAIALLRSSPRDLVHELNPQPDLVDLKKNPEASALFDAAR